MSARPKRGSVKLERMPLGEPEPVKMEPTVFQAMQQIMQVLEPFPLDEKRRIVEAVTILLGLDRPPVGKAPDEDLVKKFFGARGPSPTAIY